jgi:murein DD-endopeptidase MepM/ murein hydrolase activator NlpD
MTPINNAYSTLQQTPNYQPNFVLIKVKNTIFGDIIPIYKSQKELTSFVISSWDSFNSLVLNSRVFLVCLLSLVSEIIRNTIYQLYLLLGSAYETLDSVNSGFSTAKQNVLEAIESLSSQTSREFWWLEIKLETKKIYSKIRSNLQTTYKLLAKFYLVGVVGAALLVLGFSSNSSILTQGDGVTQNLLNKALNDYSTTQTNVTFGNVSLSSLVLNSGENGDSANQVLLERVLTHDVKEGDTIDSLSELYGLDAKTILFNNKLSEGQALPAKLYLPWTDGYIYETVADTSLEEIERIYGVSKNLIYSENEDLLDREKGSFPKGSFILIPTTDFDSVATLNKQEDVRKENIKKAEEQRKTKAVAVARSKTRTYANTQSDARSSGFIWPTTGSISRCVQGYHIACDIANSSMPPIFSVQSGTVAAVYRYTVTGYGLAVVIDHGNGIQTLYAHMSEIYVTQGQQLTQGQSIGRMGCTGLCSGTHLHFEVRVNGSKRNPLSYLP